MTEESKSSVKDAISIYITPFLLTIISFFLIALYQDIKEMKTDIEVVKREQHTMQSQMKMDREYQKSDKIAIDKFQEKMVENIDFLKQKAQELELDIAKTK